MKEKTVMQRPLFSHLSRLSLVAIFAHVRLTSLPESGREVPILHRKNLPVFYSRGALLRHPLNRVPVLGLEFDETPHQATLFRLGLK